MSKFSMEEGWDFKQGIPIKKDTYNKIRKSIKQAYANRGNGSAVLPPNCFIRLDATTWAALMHNEVIPFQFLSFLTDEALSEYYSFASQSFKQNNGDRSEPVTQAHYRRCYWKIFNLVTERRNVTNKVNEIFFRHD